MRFGSQEAESFRQEVRQWLTENLPIGWGTSSFKAPRSEGERLEFLRSWQRRLYDGGWAGLTWPVEYGGRGAGLIEEAIFLEERERVNAPPEIGKVSIGMVGPTLIKHGSEDQKRAYLQPILTGDEIWCQGFSEPNAGSDLASLSTRAKRVDNGYVISGQKVWTSMAAIADYMFLLARTNNAAPKHQGLSAFAVPMRTAGIEINPIHQINDKSDFAEVFLNDVRVPATSLVGAEDDGWRVAITTLMYERVATTRVFEAQRMFSETLNLLLTVQDDGSRLIEDPVLGNQAAELFSELAAARISYFKTVSQIAESGAVGPEPSVGKIHTNELTQRISEFALSIQGIDGLRKSESRMLGGPIEWQVEYLTSRKNTIAAGTTQILKNVIGERVLKLPR